MSDYGRLAFTGLSTVSIFGVIVDQWWIALAAVLLLIIGIATLRMGFRRGRSIDQR